MSLFREALTGGQATGRPDQGQYQAVIDEAKMVTTSSGEDKIVINWTSLGSPIYAWSSWHGFKGGAVAFTLEMLSALRINGGEIMRAHPDDDDARDVLNDQLADRAGSVFTVEISHWGDSGINCKILGAAEQARLTDAPTEPVTVPAVAADDDDIPF